jgi:RND superfamily putative drug exporter
MCVRVPSPQASAPCEVKDSQAFLPGTEVIYSKDGIVAQINVPAPGSGNDAPSTHALSVLRDQIIPATVGRVEGASVNVSGEAASSEDFASQLKSRLPLIFAFVLASPSCSCCSPSARS